MINATFVGFTSNFKSCDNDSGHIASVITLTGGCQAEREILIILFCLMIISVPDSVKECSMLF